MSKRTKPRVLYNKESEIAHLIAESRNISDMDGLRLFVNTETHTMLLDDEMKLWHFSSLAIVDMWEHEIRTGDPRNSLYLRGDEIG